MRSCGFGGSGYFGGGGRGMGRSTDSHVSCSDMVRLRVDFIRAPFPRVLSDRARHLIATASQAALIFPEKEGSSGLKTLLVPHLG
jgi:hypothetical protein